MVLIHQLLLAHCCYGIPHLEYEVASRFPLQCNWGVSLPHIGACPLWLQLCSSFSALQAFPDKHRAQFRKRAVLNLKQRLGLLRYLRTIAEAQRGLRWDVFHSMQAQLDPFEARAHIGPAGMVQQCSSGVQSKAQPIFWSTVHSWNHRNCIDTHLHGSCKLSRI